MSLCPCALCRLKNMGGSRGGTGGPDLPLPLENHKNIVFFFSNTGPDPLENHKATHVPSQHYMTDQRNGVSLAGQ